MTTYANIEHNLAFIERRERAAVQQAVVAVAALADAVALKREMCVPTLLETRPAVLELEEQVLALKLDLLRTPQDPDQLLLPGMEGLPVTKEGGNEPAAAS